MNDNKKIYLSIKDIAKTLGVSRSTAWRHAKSMRHVRLGKIFLVPRASFLSYMKAQEVLECPESTNEAKSIGVNSSLKAI